jgi:TPR repeat protein
MKKFLILILFMLLLSGYNNVYSQDDQQTVNVDNTDNIEYNFQMPDMADTIKAFQALQKELDESTEGLNYEKMFAESEKDMTDVEGMTELLKSSAQMKKTQQKMISKMKEAANDGNVGAQFQLGMTYSAGMPNAKESIKWLKKSADKGHRGAEYILGFIYGYGDGVEKNIKEADKWLSKSIKKGHKEAQKYYNEINGVK